MTDVRDWLWDRDEPWVTRVQLVDMLDRERGDRHGEEAQRRMLDHGRVAAVADDVLAEPWPPMTNHKQAKHPLHKAALLADLGLIVTDPVGRQLADRLLAHQDRTGPFQTRVQLPRAFGGSGETAWEWMGCDAPLVLYVLLSLGLGGDPRVQRAADHLAGLVSDNGWRCHNSLPKMRGPGRKHDPCPYATLVSLRALSISGLHRDSEATRLGAEMLLSHWANRGGRKLYLFGIGTDFLRLKYPFVWYDLLHVLEVLSRFPWVRGDPRFAEMLDAMTDQADGQGRYKPGSVWMAYKGFDFAQKREPSPMLTAAALRILRRAGR